jgi:hypothetical protein
MLGQADLTLELLPMRLGGNGHAALKDNIDLSHLLISIKVRPTLINAMGLLWRRHCWW